jgi:hypothetical protein
MWSRKSKKLDLNNFSTPELLSELLKRGDIPLYPGCEEDELKIGVFKNFWQQMSAMEIFNALRGQLVRVKPESRDWIHFK